MGISDRDYYRIGPRSTSGLGSLRFISVNSWIIIVNVAIFAAQVLLLGNSGVPVLVRYQVERGHPDVAVERSRLLNGVPATDADQTRVGMILAARVFDKQTGEPVGLATYQVMDRAAAYGHFSTALGFFKYEVWRLVTFQFLHQDLAHLFFNMFGLWIFGGMVEAYLGRNYLAFYLVCGIFGGLAYLFLNFMGAVVGLDLPGVLVADPRTPLIGASAGVFGVIVACAFISPQEQVIFPLVPIPIRMWLLAYGYVTIAAINLLWYGRLNQNNAGGDAAHVGGAVAGYFFVRNAHLLKGFFDVFNDSRRGTPRRRAGVNPLEVDRILAKVRATGLVSLNNDERRTLRRATEQGRRA